MWSVGVMLYAMIVGYPPFISQHMDKLFELICSTNYNFHPEDWSDKSYEVRKLITSLLEPEIDQRMTAEEAC